MSCWESFNSFEAFVFTLPKTERKNYFSVFCMNMLKIFPHMSHYNQNVYLAKDLPQDIKEEYGLENGYDLVIEKKKGYALNRDMKYVAVCCNFLDSNHTCRANGLKPFLNAATKLGGGLYISIQYKPTTFKNVEFKEPLSHIEQIYYRDFQEFKWLQCFSEYLTQTIQATWDYFNKAK